MALSKQELKEVYKIRDAIKPSGMNPWGNFRRGKQVKFIMPTSKRSKVSEDIIESGDSFEKFKNKK